MLTLIFEYAQRVTSTRDGTDILYFYKTPESDELKKIHAVGNKAFWNSFGNDRSEEIEKYKPFLFYGVESFLKKYWRDYRELPPENIELHEGRDFFIPTNAKESWDDFVIDGEVTLKLVP